MFKTEALGLDLKADLPLPGAGGVKPTDKVSFVGGFFNETLDLSQEDIQRTLSANMPLCSSANTRDNTQLTTRTTSAGVSIVNSSGVNSSRRNTRGTLVSTNARLVTSKVINLKYKGYYNF